MKVYIYLVVRLSNLIGVTDFTPFWSSKISPSYSNSACSSGVVGWCFCCNVCNGFSHTNTSAAGLHLANSVSVSLSAKSLSRFESTQSHCISLGGEGPNTCRSSDSNSSLNSLVIDVVIGKKSAGSSGELGSSLNTLITPLSLETRL